jgi:hypothetical protein
MKSFKKFLIENSSPSYYGPEPTRPKYGAPYTEHERNSGMPGFDASKSMELYNKTKSAIESHPNAQDIMIGAFSGAWSEQHGGSERKARRAFGTRISDQLRAAAGPGGFESFDHAVDAMVPIIAATPSWRAEAIGNLKETMHPDKFEELNADQQALERQLKRMAGDHSLEVASEALKHAETKIGFLN